MSTQDHPMVRRVAAAEAAIARFDGAVLAYSTNDCVRLAAFTIRKLGHKPTMPKAGTYKTLLGAAKALKAAGFDDLPAALDAMGFLRIPPAMALPGDIVAMPTAHEGWVALSVQLSNGRLLGFLADPAGGPDVCAIVQPTYADGVHPICAWRVDPCPR